MKIEDAHEYLINNKIEKIHRVVKTQAGTTRVIQFNPSNKGNKLIFTTYIRKSELEPIDDIFDLANTFVDYSNEVIGDDEYNMDIDFIENKAFVTLTRIKMGGQHIRHEIFNRLEMEIYYVKNLFDEVINDLEKEGLFNEKDE